MRSLDTKRIATLSHMGISGMKSMFTACSLLHKRYVGYIANLQHKNSMDKELVLLTKWISDYSLKGEIDNARKIFDEMPNRDSVTWNVMIRGYIKNNRIRDAQDVFDRMDEKNTVSWNSMIMAYTQERKMHIALKLFFTMPDKDVASWTTIISGLSRDSRITEAWRLFKQMPEPNSVSWSAIISGFQQNDLAALSIGQQLYSQSIKVGFENNTHVANSAISMFVKSGDFDNARHVFASIPQPDIVTWNSMVMGYGQHGYGSESITFFRQMQKAGFLPDKISLLGVLQGCSHCGLLEEALQYFRSMKMDYGISPGPEHYACMVDVLSRAGLLKEASKMIMEMPFEPASIFWRTLLSGCRIWGDLQLGVFAADRVLELEPHNSSACLMVIEMYASVGRSAEVMEVRRRMKAREASKELSYSWVEVNGRIWLFCARDETHVESFNIYNTLKLLSYDAAEHVQIHFH